MGPADLAQDRPPSPPAQRCSSPWALPDGGAGLRAAQRGRQHEVALHTLVLFQEGEGVGLNADRRVSAGRPGAASG